MKDLKKEFNKSNLQTTKLILVFICKLYYDIGSIKVGDLKIIKEFNFYTNDNENRNILPKLFMNRQFELEKIPELEYFEDSCFDSVDYLSDEYLKTEYSKDKIISILDFGEVIGRKKIIPNLTQYFGKMNTEQKSKSIIKLCFNLFEKNPILFDSHFSRNWSDFYFLTSKNTLVQLKEKDKNNEIFINGFFEQNLL